MDGKYGPIRIEAEPITMDAAGLAGNRQERVEGEALVHFRLRSSGVGVALIARPSGYSALIPI